MLSTKDLKKQDRSALVAELTKAGAIFKGNSFLCPFHDDHHPSGGIFESDTGWRFKCQSQSCGKKGDFWDVIAHNEGQAFGLSTPTSWGWGIRTMRRIMFSGYWMTVRQETI